MTKKRDVELINAMHHYNAIARRRIGEHATVIVKYDIDAGVLELSVDDGLGVRREHIVAHAIASHASDFDVVENYIEVACAEILKQCSKSVDDRHG